MKLCKYQVVKRRGLRKKMYRCSHPKEDPKEKDWWNACPCGTFLPLHKCVFLNRFYIPKRFKEED